MQDLSHWTSREVPWHDLDKGNKGMVFKAMESESESHSVMRDSLGPQGLYLLDILQARILEWVALPFSRGSS